MADTASLIARVKTEGAAEAAKQLDGFATSAESADKASDKLGNTTQKAGPKLKGFGGNAQNVGYQVQDMAVQIQGGTSWIVALGQQLPQLLGPSGAVAGAIVAVAAALGGALLKSMGDTKVSAEELQASTKTLDDVLQKNKDGVYELSDGFVALTNNIETTSQAQAKFYEAQAATVTTTEAAKDAISDLVDSVNTFSNGSAIGAQRSLELGQNTASLSGFIGDLSEKFGITNDEARTLVPLLAAVQKNASPENIKALSDQTAALNDKYNGTNGELVKFNGELFKNIGLMQDSASKADTLANQQAKLGAAANSATQRLKEQNDQIIKNVQIGNLADKQRYAAQAAADKEAFAKRDGVTKEQIAAYNAARDEESKRDIQRVTDTENKKASAEADSAAKRAASEAQAAERKDAQQKQQAQNFLDTLARQNADELKTIDAQEQQKLDKVAQFQQEGALTQQQAEEAKTKIMLDADTARQEELDKRKEEQRKKDEKGDAFIAQIQGQNATELELFDIQQKQKEEVAKSYRDQGLINEQEYQAALVAIAGQYNKKRRTEYANMLGQTTDDLRTALGEGNKMYKAFAIANAIMNTYQGAVAAFQSAAAIPIVGWVAAPIAAAAAVAAGLANVAKIRSAREQGGSLAAGGIAMVGERNKAELIMPAGASRVRTMEQVQQMMGNTKGNRSGNDSVVIVNNTTGRIDQATTERDDEGRLRVIISETVSAAFQDSNSDISKSRRGTRGLPGY